VESLLFRAAFYDSSIPQTITDIEGTFVVVNEAFCQYFGRSQAELLNSKFSDYTPDGDETPGLDLRKELEVSKHWCAKKKYMRKDGTLLRATLSVSGIYSEGCLQHVLAQIQDQSASYSLLDQLKRKQEEIEQFAYITSHDLREPLITMAGYASLLQRRCAGLVDVDGKRWLEEILNSTQNMEQKIDDLLAFSKAGRSTLSGSFPLGSAVDEAKRSVVRALEESSGTIVLKCRESPMIQGDRSMIAQVFQNLFSNSLKYRRDETPKIEVEAERYDDHTWHISVSDNGLGFDMQFKDRIFGIFQRLYTVQQYPGTGIGLAIAKKIIERHEGVIWPDSAIGVGSTFHFTLPASKT
jgi:PAS domain S-box-containing protein